MKLNSFVLILELLFVLSFCGCRSSLSDSDFGTISQTSTYEIKVLSDSSLNGKASIVGHIVCHVAKPPFDSSKVAIIKGVGVQILGPSYQNTLVDSLGFYEFTNLIPGKYILKYTRQGYNPFEVNDIELKENQSSIIDVKLGYSIRVVI
jgi:hypothetical protein